ncbi:MAG: D-aminoacyl-tRNA deacylase [Smithellaceae bacterium]|nr:D-tyrosyl-tRNA(Tyr) deacylase [Syntrophaceae bacterium]MDD4240077.1 D-aminoacyl-tRNA deacylase [Smithellaceae bacterium]NLX51441.1 D-tyrosyl-tRNA(Tyr) deacylase [Deltaproteobacteria bacterium]
MRAVIQRVDRACVRINSQVYSFINRGVLLLLGVEKGDSEKDADYILEKTVHLRIFEDDRAKMNLSLSDIAGEMLVVSQFTLLGDCSKGRRPSFTEAEEPAKANALYEYFVGSAASRVKKLAAGKFQEMMDVELINNGPVTLLLDSRKLSYNDRKRH